MAPPTDIIAISSDSETDNEEHNEPNTWVASMTKSKCSGKQTLCVPSWIRDSWFAHEPEYMFVRYDQEPLQFWELKWHEDPRNCVIGHDWYEFCKRFKLKIGDEVAFTKVGSSFIIKVSIHRKC